MSSRSMKSHPFLIIRDNKQWIIKALFMLFCVIACIIFLAHTYTIINTRYHHCNTLPSLFLALGLVNIIFTSCVAVIFFMQWRNRAASEREYSTLELHEEDSQDPQEDIVELQEDFEPARSKRVQCALGGVKYAVYSFTMFLSLVLVAFMISYAALEAHTLPKINGTLNLKGLIADATIQREKDGVLHIKASNTHDMYFAQGVAMAQERLWQMEFYRRLGKGALSEILGNDTLDVDILFRTLGFWEASQASLNHFSPDALAVGNAFIEGINSYLNSDPPLPTEFQLLGISPDPYVLADSMLMVKILALDLAGNFQREYLYQEFISLGLSQQRIDELVPDYPPNVPTILDDEDIRHINFTHKFEPMEFTRTFTKSNKKARANGSSPTINVHDLLRQSGVLRGLNLGFKSASNNWVINGNRTVTGKPLLCNDPHLTITAPSIWILMHLESPNISVIGATPVLAPGIVIGRNSKIAWGVTNTFIDVQDLYLLQTNDVGESYYHNSSWVDFEVREEIIVIKGAADHRMEVRESLYGPVISDAISMPGKTAALRWTSLDDNDTTFEALLKISMAQNFDDFRDALRYFVGPSQNFIYADINGNIGYQVPGKIPMRVANHSGMYPVNGTGEYDWIGWIPYDELPYVLNPSKGYIVTANNKITPPSYPYPLLNDKDWEEHYRALTIIQLINSTNANSIETMKAIQYNRVTGVFHDLLPFISSIPDSMLDSSALEWKKKLIEWDGNETPDSVEATVFEYMFIILGRLGSDSGYYSWAYPYYILKYLSNDLSAECQGNCMTVLAKALTNAVSEANNKKWGDVHPLLIEHPVMTASPIACLYNREAPIGGSSYTVNIGAYDSRFLNATPNAFDSRLGASYRQIVDLSNMDQSLFIIPMGNSGNVMDANYDDMLDDFLDGKYVPMKMNDYQVSHTLRIHKNSKPVLRLG